MYQAPPQPEEKEAAKRLTWTREVAAQVTSPDGVWRVARRIDGSTVPGAKHYYTVQGATTLHYHLRPCLGNQITADLGDHVDQKPQAWPDVVAQAHAISDACHQLGVWHYMSLSGGKGIHIEIWLPPDESRCADDGGEDRRWPIWCGILAQANRLLYGENMEGKRIPFDPIFIAPREGSYLLTENGERKAAGSPLRKLLWYEGIGPTPRIPVDKKEAYRVAELGLICPSQIKQSQAAACHDTTWVKQLTGKPCPQGPQCLDYSEGWTCSNCPIQE